MTSPAEVLSRCSTLDQARRIEAAKLVAEAMSGLYEPVGCEAAAMLAAEFLVIGSELSEAMAAIGPTVHGIIASYPASEYRPRQSVSLHHALSNLSADAGRTLVKQLREMAGQFPGAAPEGEYLARFAVASTLRGTGSADHLFEAFLRRHKSVSLHVRCGNARAIHFYQRHGLRTKAVGRDLVLMGSD